MLLTLAPILDGNGQGPHRGAVLMGRLLSKKRIAQLAEQAQVDLAMRVLHSPYDVQPTRTSAPVTTRIVRRPTTNEVYRQVVDIYGRTALMLRIDVPRSITAKGEARDAVRALVAAGRRHRRTAGADPRDTPDDPGAGEPHDAARRADRRA